MPLYGLEKKHCSANVGQAEIKKKKHLTLAAPLVQGTTCIPVLGAGSYWMLGIDSGLRSVGSPWPRWVVVVVNSGFPEDGLRAAGGVQSDRLGWLRWRGRWSKPGQKQQGWSLNDLGSGADRMWWLSGESGVCSGFWLRQVGRVWGQTEHGEGAAQKEETASQHRVGDRVSFINVDLKVPFKSLKR